MATITNVPRAKGHAWKAIIRHKGRTLASKCFSTKTAARAWAKRVETDQEMMRALGSPGARITFAELADELMDQWSGKDKSYPSRIAWWCKHLGTVTFRPDSGGLIRPILDEMPRGIPGRRRENHRRRQRGTKRMAGRSERPGE